MTHHQKVTCRLTGDNEVLSHSVLAQCFGRMYERILFGYRIL
jgi:hypothetical protein